MRKLVGREHVVGLDLSLTGTGCAAIPIGWRPGTWKHVVTERIAVKVEATVEVDRAARLDAIARRVVSFAKKHRAAKVFIEGYAFGMVRQAHHLGELGGVIRVELLRAGVIFATAQLTTARKFLLGKMPKKDVKALVASQLDRAGARFPTGDEADAFVIANFGLTELGYRGLTMAGA